MSNGAKTQPWQNTGNIRCRDTENNFLAQSEDDGGLTFLNQVVEDAIDELSSGKSPYEYGLAAEYLKAAKHHKIQWSKRHQSQ